MKFGYRDRIVLMIVLIVVILGLGIFVLIKPKWEELNNNKTKRDELTKTWESKMLEFDRIPLRQEKIIKRYEQGNEISQNFTDEMTSVELDEFLQAKFINTDANKEGKVTLMDNVAISEQGTASMSYYYSTPNIVTYPLYEAADLDGSLALAAAEKMANSRLFASRSTQTVGSSNATLILKINRERTMELLDAVKAYAEANKDTMMIESVQLSKADFNEANLPKLDEDGNPIEDQNANADEKKNADKDGFEPGYSKVTIAYRVFYMQEPTKPDVGPSYDKAIWNGDAWRTAVAE